ncbi:LysR family transcriptional regulator [Enterobacter cloacae]|uniref:LysR family transcriptional regulator n=1 Tax=Atlantibacter subterraneus TaxID=255519 RepID=A0ABU4E5S9_9ENTR|nr:MULTISPECIES: LysR family transcriptional regulator [Enterobacteriaceae]MDZ5667522.1 LysR family transcriptional regulator [Atlantibacter hermannii]MCD1394855.1 LysR family transcriptional regulator [Enterobacter cloacae]MCO4152206.1 LysR family transcriptional regulator [Citrobacter freundii]MCO4179030.1 LysR family transcriptional regulator [Citrobacter freundii]MDK7604144.1 LysR family transcriptional regulator [Citrobacter freundii]
MNIKQLKYFCRVVELGSISAAANDFSLAAPAVSMQISSLEKELNGILFDRSSRPMGLTKLGEFVYQRAPEIIYNLEKLERDAIFYINSKSTTLSICFVRSLMFNILPESIKYHLDSHNHIDISLREVLSEYQTELLLSQELDIGFSRLMDADISLSNDLENELILVDPLIAAIPKNHYLSRRKFITLRDFCSSPFIIYPSDPKSDYSKSIFSKFEDYGIKPAISHRVVEIHTALALVGAGLGVTLVGGSTIKNNRHDVVFLPIEDFKCLSFIYAMYHPKNKNPNINPFIESMKMVTSL